MHHAPSSSGQNSCSWMLSYFQIRRSYTIFFTHMGINKMNIHYGDSMRRLRAAYTHICILSNRTWTAIQIVTCIHSSTWEKKTTSTHNLTPMIWIFYAFAIKQILCMNKNRQLWWESLGFSESDLKAMLGCDIPVNRKTLKQIEYVENGNSREINRIGCQFVWVGVHRLEQRWKVFVGDYFLNAFLYTLSVHTKFYLYRYTNYESHWFSYLQL